MGMRKYCWKIAKEVRGFYEEVGMRTGMRIILYDKSEALNFMWDGVCMFRQNEMWRPVIAELYNTLYAEQMVCSMSTQLFHISETQNLEGNVEMHTHLVPASYHRVTAAGSAQRLWNGESETSLVETLTSCINNAEQQDQDVRAGLNVMRNAAPANYKPFVDNIIRWQGITEQHLQNAKRMTQQIVGS